jgi:hypothetical protein
VRGPGETVRNTAEGAGDAAGAQCSLRRHCCACQARSAGRAAGLTSIHQDEQAGLDVGVGGRRGADGGAQQRRLGHAQQLGGGAQVVGLQQRAAPAAERGGGGRGGTSPAWRCNWAAARSDGHAGKQHPFQPLFIRRHTERTAPLPPPRHWRNQEAPACRPAQPPAHLQLMVASSGRGTSAPRSILPRMGSKS